MVYTCAAQCPHGLFTSSCPSVRGLAAHLFIVCVHFCSVNMLLEGFYLCAQVVDNKSFLLCVLLAFLLCVPRPSPPTVSGGRPYGPGRAGHTDHMVVKQDNDVA